ncbi:aspartyl protease family protein [Rhizobium sp. RU20A]|uniref:retropepsin-like aspartic protease family protein n=1 Tax=Rhizobium sp. RU20A TaxID=1907412 RepID=UPI00095607B5|nr:TIGR02281 family clan AA aspartic protease [Rhizobium sp. RU20A]SIQ14587.1 aspartyl protease family protein [Rhizobium sp. RU20A]
MKRLVVALSILGGGLVLLVLNHESGSTFGLANENFESVVSLTAIAVMIGSGIVASRRQFGESVRQMAVWLLILLALVSAYLYRQDLQNYGERLAAGLLPGRASVITDSEGGQEVVLHKMLNGHFEADVEVNGASLDMLVDTGASSVVLTFDDARRAGIDTSALSFTLPVMTANGQAMAAPVDLADIAIGPIARKGIRAVVTREGQLDQSLLGMSFLSTLDFLQMQTDELRLRD